MYYHVCLSQGAKRSWGTAVINPWLLEKSGRTRRIRSEFSAQPVSLLLAVDHHSLSLDLAPSFYVFSIEIPQSDNK